MEQSLAFLTGGRLLAMGLLLACGHAFAQAPAGEGDRVARRCTGATLGTDPSAPCADDVLKDTSAPRVVRPPVDTTVPVSPPNSGTSTLPGAPVTSGGVTPGTPASVTSQTTPGTPSTSSGAAPGTSGSMTSQTTPGTPNTSVGTTPGKSAAR
jgi:hypothetical protein